MKLKNILIVVKDIEKSKEFYHKLFGLETILDNDGNRTLSAFTAFHRFFRLLFRAAYQISH